MMTSPIKGIVQLDDGELACRMAEALGYKRPYGLRGSAALRKMLPSDQISAFLGAAAAACDYAGEQCASAGVRCA